MVWWAAFLLGTAASALQLTDEQYYQMPKLFHLDNYEECFASPRGAFCLGSFDLHAPGRSPLMDVLIEFSRDTISKFNHTRLHRGYCVSSRCSDIDEPRLERRFRKCVSNHTWLKYGLVAKAQKLDYCRTSRDPGKPVDLLDIFFACLIAAVVLLNVGGTLYDVMRNPDYEPNRYLMPWSLTVNWRRLTATHEKGDERLAALAPIQGMKALSLIFVILAHTVLVYHLSYIHNPEFFEKANRTWMSMLLQNGSVIVQTFVLISSFLLAYNLLLTADRKPEGLAFIPTLLRCIVHRYVRLAPVHMFMVGLTATWGPRLSSGPLWAPLVEAEAASCRRKWWTHALFLNNLIDPDDQCLVQSWFVAVDLQLYVVAGMLTLALLRWRHAAKLLAALFFASILFNFGIAYNWNLESMLFKMYPEIMRRRHDGDASFKWLYTAPWGSTPSMLLGLVTAFLYHQLQNHGFKFEGSKVNTPRPVLGVRAGYVRVGDTGGALDAAGAAAAVAGRGVRGRGPARVCRAGGHRYGRLLQQDRQRVVAAPELARLAGARPHVAVGAHGALDRQPHADGDAHTNVDGLRFRNRHPVVWNNIFDISFVAVSTLGIRVTYAKVTGNTSKVINIFTVVLNQRHPD